MNRRNLKNIEHTYNEYQLTVKERRKVDVSRMKILLQICATSTTRKNSENKHTLPHRAVCNSSIVGDKRRWDRFVAQARKTESRVNCDPSKECKHT
jgi:hypothetical protein